VFGAELIVREDPYPEDGSIRVKVHAIDPERDDQVFHFRETVEEGRYLEPGEDGVLLGAWLAEDLGARVGYAMTLVTRTRTGYYQAIDTEIVGIINCPNPYINRSSVFMPLDSADYHLEMEGAVTEINMRFPLRADADKRAAEIQESLTDHSQTLQVMSWREIAFDYVALAEQKQAGSGLILFLVFIIAAVGVSNTMLMAVYERTKELGTMRALGMKDSQIRWTFLFEAGGIGFIGSVLGLILGSLLVFWMVNWGIDYGAMIRQADMGYRIASVFRGVWHPTAMIQAFVLGIVIAMIVALVPTRRALRMRITDCLRDE
jgi:ABC-type lipoprotein release transport system permease subunit